MKLYTQTRNDFYDYLLTKMQRSPGEYLTAAEWHQSIAKDWQAIINVATVRSALIWHVENNGHVVKMNRVGRNVYYGVER